LGIQKVACAFLFQVLYFSSWIHPTLASITWNFPIPERQRKFVHRDLYFLDVAVLLSGWGVHLVPWPLCWGAPGQNGGSNGVTTAAAGITGQYVWQVMKHMEPQVK
jgi:hypothetical protein